MYAGIDFIVASNQCFGSINTPFQQTFGTIQMIVGLQGALQLFARRYAAIFFLNLIMHSFHQLDIAYVWWKLTLAHLDFDNRITKIDSSSTYRNSVKGYVVFGGSPGKSIIIKKKTMKFMVLKKRP